VIYFNPADPDFHMGFNILELPDPKYKHLVASGLMGIFTKIWANVWSARMEYILNNAVLALLETPGSTLLGIPRLLVDKEYRARIVGNVTDPVVKAFWMNEFESWQEKFRNEAIAPIQNKVGQFLSTALIRNVVGQSKSTIDIYRLMNEGKIFLVNVSKGRIGEDNSALLGAMLITKIQLAAMERVRIPNEDDRKDFFLYVDEFQNFATDSFAGILSEARKYRLNLTIAHQYIGQLVTDVSTKVRDAVFGNVGTMISFRVGAADAEFLEKEFSPEFMMQDLVNLPNFCIYLKLMVDGMTCRPFSATTLAPLKGGSRVVSPDEIVEYSRTHYCRPRSEVEREINQWSGIFVDEETSVPQTERERKADDKDEGDGFKAHCSRCDKKITLPFAPESGRPVYCKTCFTKVKEERAIAGSSRYVPELAELGIEFPLKPEPKKDERPRMPVRQAPRVPPPPKPKSISLSSLTPSDPTIQPRVKEQKGSVDIQALRDAIRKSLGTNPS
jgi:CxxC-x17-CxxC domain-containing protein